MKLFLCNIILLLFIIPVYTQNRIAYRFLELPITTEGSAMGGFNHSVFTENLSFTFHNPALLREEMSQQMHFTFNNFYQQTKQLHLQSAWKHNNSEWILSPAIAYLNYGKINQTDIYAIENGTSNANDWVVQVSAAKSYLNNWNYGLTLKYLHSQIAYVKSNAVAVDLGLNYRDTVVGIQAALVLKNIGTILSQYAPNENNILPFDVQWSISYKLFKIPLQLSLNSFQFPLIDHYRKTDKSPFIEQLFLKTILSAEWNIEDKIRLQLGYRYQRKKDWSILDRSSGLVGWSSGISFYHKKFQLYYSITPMQQKSFQQFSVAIPLQKKSLF